MTRSISHHSDMTECKDSNLSIKGSGDRIQKGVAPNQATFEEKSPTEGFEPMNLVNYPKKVWQRDFHVCNDLHNANECLNHSGEELFEKDESFANPSLCESLEKRSEFEKKSRNLKNIESGVNTENIKGSAKKDSK